MIAAEHRDGVARADAALGEAAGDRRRTVVELDEGQRAPFVDQGRAVPVALGAQREERGEAGAPVPDGLGDTPEPVGPLRAEQSGAEQRR